MTNIIRAALTAALAFSIAGSACAADKFLADRHIDRGLKCESCHTGAKPDANVDMKTCLQCHKREDVAAKTKQLEPNPHTAPHNNDCTLCHMQHEPEVNYCEQCHQFNFKMKH